MKASRSEADRRSRAGGRLRAGARSIAGLALIAIVAAACSAGTPKNGGVEPSKLAPKATTAAAESPLPEVPATSAPAVPPTSAPEVPATSAPDVPATSAPTGALPDGVRAFDIASESHGVHLFSLVAGQGSLWVPDEMGPWMYRVDPGSGDVTDIRLAEGSGFADVADSRAIFAMGSVWVADGLPDGHVYRVDPKTGEVLHTFTVVTPLALSSGFGSIWVSSFDLYGVLRIDPSTNEVVAAIDATGPLSLVPSSEGMWVLEHRANTLGLIDPDKNKIVRRISFDAQFPERMAASMGSLWVSSPAGDEVLRFDPDAGKLVSRVAVGGHPYEMADGPGGLWISSEDGLYRIGKGSELAGPIPLDGQVTGVAIHAGQVWTTRVDGTTLFAVDPSSL